MASEIRWGILSTADIARKVCVAFAEATNASCVAVASRDKAKAEAFIGENCSGARAYGSYDELLDDADIQAVYIPLPTAMRAEWVVKAAAKKKHVLCEKPIAVSVEETLRVMDACKEAGVQFMDNTMFMHNPRTAHIRAVLDDKANFGTPSHVVSSFSIPLAATNEAFRSSNIRMKKATEPLGALGDLGWYNARFILWAYGYETPEAVSCHFVDKTDEGVPIAVLANLKFSGGRTASFDCSFTHAWRNWSEIASENCHLRVEDFVITATPDSCSFSILKGGCADRALTFPIESSTTDVKSKAQHSLLIEKFSNIVASGAIEDEWPRLAKQTNLLLLALRSSAEQNGAWIAPDSL